MAYFNVPYKFGKPEECCLGRKARLAFAKTYEEKSVDFWRSVMFVDEMRFGYFL